MRRGVNLSTGGRASCRISLNRAGPLVLVMGVDLSQMEMRLGLFDLSGALVDGRRVPFERRGDQIKLRRIVAEIEHFAQAGHQRLAGVGLAVPGYLEAASDRVIYSANLGWRDRPGP